MKLDFTKLGPFKIKRKLSPVTFELQLPSDSRLYPVFHAALLESVPSQVPVQTTLQTNGEKEYEVAEILDTRTTFSNKEYLVSWKGYSREENSWEPEANLQKCQQAISSYYQRHPETPNLTSQVRPLHPRKTKAKQWRRAQGLVHQHSREALDTSIQTGGFGGPDPPGNPTASANEQHEKKLPQQPEEHPKRPVRLSEQLPEDVPARPPSDDLGKRLGGNAQETKTENKRSTSLRARLHVRAARMHSEQWPEERSTRQGASRRQQRSQRFAITRP